MTQTTSDDKLEDEQPTSGWRKCFNIVCCPFILCFYSIKIFFCGCILAKCEDCLHCLQACCCSCLGFIFCGGCGICARQFRDKEFGPECSEKSLGRPAKGITWIPFEELLAAANPSKECDVLIAGNIEPSAVGQGDLGDCWLMSAISAVAEHPSLIVQTMRTHRHNVRGKYEFRLYNDNPGEQSFETVEVDNLLPTADGKTPVFAALKVDAWVAMLQKAVAKFVGSYEKLDGGSTAWALTALTGGKTAVVLKEANGSWKRWESVWGGDRANMRKSSLRRAGNGPMYSRDELWNLLVDHDSRHSVMCCSVTQGSTDRESIRGLACSHAYSLLRAVEVEGFKLVEIRNPWGASGTVAGKKGERAQSRGEWDGDWSDASDMWERHPNVKKKLSEKEAVNLLPDGKFFMNFTDFCTYFGSVSICSRATGFGDIVLVVDDGQTCGTCCACVKGCCDFWCCCTGLKALCCAEERRD